MSQSPIMIHCLWGRPRGSGGAYLEVTATHKVRPCNGLISGILLIHQKLLEGGEVFGHEDALFLSFHEGGEAVGNGDGHADG